MSLWHAEGRVQSIHSPWGDRGGMAVHGLMGSLGGDYIGADRRPVPGAPDPRADTR